MKRIFTLLAFLLILSTTVSAYDFKVDCIYYDINEDVKNVKESFKNSDDYFLKDNSNQSEAQDVSVETEQPFNIMESVARANDLLNKGHFNMNSGKYREAINDYTEARDLYRLFELELYYVFGNEYLVLVASISSNIGDCHRFLEEYEDAIDNYSVTLNIYLSQGNKLKAAKHAAVIGDCYLNLKDYDKAKRYYNDALQKYDDLGEENEAADMLGNIALCYYAQGDYLTASAYQVLANNERLKTEVNGDNNAKILLSKGDNALMFQGLPKDALNYYYQAKEAYLANGDTIMAASVLSSIGLCHILLNEKEEADKSLNESIKFYSSIGAENVVAALLYQYGFNFYLQGRHKDAINTLTKGLELFIKTDCENSYIVTDVSSLIGLCYYNLHDYPNAYKYTKKSCDIRCRQIINSLRTFTTEERYSLWEQHSEFFTKTLPHITLVYNGPSVAEELYNNSALFAKGLMLSADTEIERLIHESGNSNAQRTLAELQNVRDSLRIIREKNNGLNESLRLRQKTLEEQEEKLEKELLDFLNGLEEYGDFTKNMQIKWPEVQKNLGKKSIAIEFLSFPNEKNNIEYIALTLRSGNEPPKISKLCEEKDLKAAIDKAYTSDALSKLIWEPLAKELEGVDTIYFSPSGLLHTIAIESMPHWEVKGSLMCDKYKIFRLSSTRELAMKRKPVEGTNGALLYGGFNYSCSIDEMAPTQFTAEMTHTMNDATTNESFAYIDNDDLDIGARLSESVASQLLGGEWNDISSGIAAVNSIEGFLKQQEYPVEKVHGTKATETSFKILSKKKEIIVLYTHGFYWDKSRALEEIKELEKAITRQASHEKVLPFMQIDNAMTRCGLVFNGGNHVRKGDFIPANYDDGILTAQEIANLDLRGLDLIFLSACQTALGEVNGDGVFGLQRGFKKAGAQSIIMSLWEVDSKATATMMHEFFKAWNCGDGKNKREAFVEAQKQVRKIYGDKYDDKKHQGPHWASFILLDAAE